MSSGRLNAGVIEYAGSNNPGWINNLGISLSGGTLTIVDAQGATIMDANPGWVTTPSTTAGRFATLKVTAGGSFNDDAHASSDLTNLGFGIDETNNWAQDVPFFLYAVNRANSNITATDGDSKFFLARIPTLNLTPASADDIGDTDALPVNDSQNVILVMGGVTQANYINLPCTLIGSIRMRWSTVTDDWTIQALGSTDGLGFNQVQQQLKQLFTFPTEQNGAGGGSHIRANGGTAPVFSTNNYFYSINIFGTVHCFVSLSGDGGTDGAGAVSTLLAVPYACNSSIDLYGTGAFQMNSSVTGEQIVLPRMDASDTFVDLVEGAGTLVQNADFGNGGRHLRGSIIFKIS